MNAAEPYEVIVIGGGKGGKTFALDLGKDGVRTALIERDPDMIGGSCINLACIPTKTFIESAKVAHIAGNAAAYGIDAGRPSVNWPAVRGRVTELVAGMRATNHKLFTSVEALDFIVGRARFTGPRTVEVATAEGATRTLTAPRIFINTGSRPAVPAIDGLSVDDVLDSTSVQRLAALPPHLLILGAVMSLSNLPSSFAASAAKSRSSSAARSFSRGRTRTLRPRLRRCFRAKASRSC